MNCCLARRTLYPSPERCALTVESHLALEHVRQCAECRRYFEAETEWTRLFRAKLPTLTAPDALRTRITGMVERAQGMPSRRIRRGIIAAVFLLALLPALWLVSHFRSRLLFESMCKDHAKLLSSSPQLQSSDTTEIESWFRDKSDFAVRVPLLRNADVVGGRLCLLRGRKAALVVYRREGRSVSLFQLSDSRVNFAALDRWEVEGVALWRASWKGYSLAAFQHRGVVYALVSDLRESELLELASTARVRVQGY